MKKINCFLPIVIIVFVALGCGESEPPKPPVENEKITIDAGKKEGKLPVGTMYTYSVDVKKNSQVYVNLEGDPDLLPNMALKNEQGSTLNFGYATNELGYSQTETWFKFNSDLGGKFFIELRGANRPIKYRIQLKGGCGTGSFDSLRKLKMGDPFIEDSIKESGDAVDYIYDAKRGKTIVAIQPDNTLTPYLEVLDENCNSFPIYQKYNRGKPTEAEFTPQFDGRYLIRIRMQSGMAGKYRIALRQ